MGNKPSVWRHEQLMRVGPTSSFIFFGDKISLQKLMHKCSKKEGQQTHFAYDLRPTLVILKASRWSWKTTKQSGTWALEKMFPSQHLMIIQSMHVSLCDCCRSPLIISEFRGALCQIRDDALYCKSTNKPHVNMTSWWHSTHFASSLSWTRHPVSVLFLTILFQVQPTFKAWKQRGKVL